MDVQNLLVKFKIVHFCSQPANYKVHTLAPHALDLGNICIEVCLRNVPKIIPEIF